MKRAPKKVARSINGRLEEYFCSKSVFHCNTRLTKDLRFAFTPTKTNEIDLSNDFNEFERKVRCKWFFLDKHIENFSERSAFQCRSDLEPT